MQKAGNIRELRRQVPFPIYIKGIKICDWLADFVYDVRWGPPASPDWRREIEDTKGMRTDVYKIKKKLVEAEYGFRIKET